MVHFKSMSGLWLWGAVVLSGVLGFLGYAGFDRFYLEWIFLIPLLWAIGDQRPRRAFWLGWAAGLVGHAGGFYWIVYMFQEFAGMTLMPAVLGLILLAAAIGMLMAIWAWGTRMIVSNTGWSVMWVSPILWTALEKFWPQVFPNSLGASQYPLIYLTQIADVTGVLGLSFLVVYINAFLYSLLERRLANQSLSWRPVVVFACVMAAVVVYGVVRVQQVDRNTVSAGKLTVGLVQTNLGRGEKHADRERFLREHQEMSRKLLLNNKVDLLVWPENVLSVSLSRREGIIPPEVLGRLGVPVLFGAVVRAEGLGEPRFFNSAVFAGADGRIIGTYDKMVLVPFGEYIPFGDLFPVLYSWSPYSSRFEAGDNIEPVIFNGSPVSINICYEDIFPSHIRLLMQGGREGRIPEVMFNLTDDSWYGDTVEPMEHLALASFRAIEHRRFLVRSTPTGISAIVDPVGRVERRTGQWTPETLTGVVSLLQGRTIYALWGDVIGWVCAVAVLIAAGVAVYRRRTEKRRK